MPDNEELIEQQPETQEPEETPAVDGEETEIREPEETETPAGQNQANETEPPAVPQILSLGNPVVPLAASPQEEAVASSADDEGDEEKSVIDVNDLEENKPHHIVFLGRQGENKTQDIEIDCSHWAEVLENPVYSIVARRPGEKETYLAHLVATASNRITWTLDSDDTARSGFGEAEIRGVSGDKVKKSAKFRTWIEPSVEDYTNPDPVTPPYWGTEILEATAAAEAAAEAAEAAAEHADGSAVRFDIDQTATIDAEEKQQARRNIGAAAVSVTEHTLTIGL